VPFKELRRSEPKRSSLMVRPVAVRVKHKIDLKSFFLTVGHLASGWTRTSSCRYLV
jgi:hypothetical protein